MRSSGWTERALGAAIALTLVAGLGAVALHDDGDDGRSTAAGAPAVRRPSSTTDRQEPLAAPSTFGETDTTATSGGTGQPAASRSTRRTSTSFAGVFSSSTAPLPPDTLAPPPTEEPAPPPPPPSDDVANELIAGVLDLVDVDPGSGCSGQPLDGSGGDCVPASG